MSIYIHILNTHRSNNCSRVMKKVSSFCESHSKCPSQHHFYNTVAWARVIRQVIKQVVWFCLIETDRKCPSLPQIQSRGNVHQVHLHIAFIQYIPMEKQKYNENSREHLNHIQLKNLLPCFGLSMKQMIHPITCHQVCNGFNNKSIRMPS